MAALFCMLLPPLLLITIRKKLGGGQEETGIRKKDIVEYLISVLLLNVLVIGVTCIVFHHSAGFIDALNHYMDFSFHYLILAIVFAVLIPVIEHFVSIQIKIEPVHIDWKKGFRLLLYLTAVMLFCMNLPRIFDNAFWGDEGFTIRLAKMSVGEMIQATAADVHPHLYYLWVQLLYHIGGNNGITYHLSALIPYGLLLVFACTAIRKQFGTIPAAVLIILSSFMKQSVTYNVEVRMYSLAALFVLAAFYELYKIFDSGKVIHWVFFTLASLAAAYTHYYALISVAFFYVVLWGLMLLRKKYIKQTILISTLTVLGYMPWLGILLTTFGRTSEGWWLESIPSFKDGMLAVFDYQWLCWVTLLVIIIYVFYQLNIIGLISSGKGSNYKLKIQCKIGDSTKISSETLWILTGVLSVVGTLLVGLLLSYAIRPLFVVRYLYVATPAAYLILGVCLKKMHFSRIWAVLLIGAVLWNNVPSFFNTYQGERSLNQNTATFLDQVQPEKSEKIYTNNTHLGWSLLEYYYPENPRAYIGEITDILNEDYENSWLFWTTPLSEEAYRVLEDAGYSVLKKFEGTFANGVYYYVYMVQKVL